MTFAGCLAASAIYPAAAQQASERPAYELGKGYRLPGGKLTAGGYLSARYSDPDNGAWSAQVRDLSLFLSGDLGNRWQLFSETELGEAVTLDGDGLTLKDADIDIERLYLDYRAAPRWSLRVGKFLTPVGQWNLIHADPLVWTVSRPLTTAAPFARHATGAMLHGSRALGAQGLDYTLYVDATNSLDPTERSERAFTEAPEDALNPRNAFDWAAGVQLRYRTLDDRLQLGLSAAHFRLDGSHDEKDLLGTDLHWGVGRAEISSEAVYRRGDGPDEWGGFVQLLLPITRGWYAVGYYERYKPAILDDAVNIRSLGVAFQPRAAIKLKLERRDGNNNETVAPDAWLASFAVLF
jgi:hypothetical protein